MPEEGMNAESRQDLPAPPQRRPRKRTSGPVVPHPPRWFHRVLAWAIFALIKSVSATLRYRWNDRFGYLQNARGQAIFCIWHNRLALCMPPYPRIRRATGSPGMAAMVSASRDGGFLVAVLEAFRIAPVRGSSSRRGPQALLELKSWAERGWDLAITPDGPRGPRYVVQDGVTSLAQVTGLPIVPFSWNADWKIQVRSWDRFQIPLPFSRCELAIGQPLRVPRDATDEQREQCRLELENRLKSLSRD